MVPRRVFCVDCAASSQSVPDRTCEGRRIERVSSAQLSRNHSCLRTSALHAGECSIRFHGASCSVLERPCAIASRLAPAAHHPFSSRFQSSAILVPEPVVPAATTVLARVFSFNTKIFSQPRRGGESQSFRSLFPLEGCLTPDLAISIRFDILPVTNA